MSEWPYDLGELVGLPLARAGYSGGLSLTLGDQPEWIVRIESPCLLSDGLRRRHVVSYPLHEALPALPMLGSALGSLVVVVATGADGSLSLEFESGLAVSVPVDPDFEAWTISGPNGALASPPGGPRLVT